MFERYTVHARRAIFFARFEAAFQSADKITTGHLLVGLMRDADSRAVAVGSLKDNEVKLRIVLGIPSPTSGIMPNRDTLLPLDENSKMVLALAAEEADMDEEYWIDTDHLLRGLLCLPNEASDAFHSISLDLTTARSASKRHRIEFPSKKTLYHRLFGSPIRAHRIFFLKLLIWLIVVTFAVLLIRWIN